MQLMHMLNCLNSCELLRRLAVGALLDRLSLATHDPGLHRLELLHEAVELDHQVADDREVRERRDLDGLAVVVERGSLQVSLGSPFTLMPQLPQTAMRHDQRWESVGSTSSLM